jgi:hypothetical protein
MPVIDRTDFLARTPPLMTVNNGSTVVSQAAL